MSYCVFIQCLIIHVAMSLCLCHYRYGHLKIVEYLIKARADVHSMERLHFIMLVCELMREYTTVS